MKNFIFLSPNFPESYWKFCAELKSNGLRVLGIGDSPYDNLKQELRDALHEYYKVSDLGNYDEVFKAVAFFTYKYGKIDWLESNNEYWLERDAKLRTEFHITSGFMEADMEPVKYKSAMKAYYAKAGIPAARYHMADTYEGCAAFIEKVGYPVVVKPDNGVGANATYRLRCDADLKNFIETKPNVPYIMEELVNGVVCTYDAIINSEGKPLFEASNVTPVSLMDVVNDSGDCIFYIQKRIPADIRSAGLRTVEAYGVKSRFVHLEFFRLREDQPGLGKKGDLIGLEVNMRPSGGVTPDMYNYAYETDVYKLWADVIAFGHCTTNVYNARHYCAYVGRRDRAYALDHNAIMERYGYCMKMQGRMPDAIADCMGNEMYVCNFDTYEQLQQFFKELLEV